jgi:hypothetical protein
MNRAIMQQALTALNTCDWDYDSEEEPYKTFDEDLVNAAAAALKEALAEPDLRIEANRVAYDVAMHYANKTKEKLSEQEPVRWFQQFGDAPPKREWVGLTQEERDELLNYSTSVPSRLIDWTEAKLKEKNSD